MTYKNLHLLNRRAILILLGKLVISSSLFSGCGDRSTTDLEQENIDISPIEIKNRKVFAHYMVCCPSYGSTVEGMKKEILQAQSAGIDGFVLNCGGWFNEKYKLKSQMMYDTVKSLGTKFKLFFSLDGCCGNGPEVAIDMVTTFGRHPAQFMYQNQVVLSSWAAGDRSYWLDKVLNPLEKIGYSVCFVPFFYTEPVSELPNFNLIKKSYYAWWKDVVNGLFYFGAAGLPEEINQTAEAYAKFVRDVEKIYMAPLSPYYWGMKQSGGRRYYEYQGGEGIAVQWESIISKQNPQWVEITTWNDFNESYICPLSNDEQAHYYMDFLPRGFLKPHVGYLELSKYYIEWYKTGTKPEINTNSIYYFYRTHPKDINTSMDPLGPVYKRIGNLEDVIYLTTITKDILKVRVTSGKTQKTLQIFPGISHSRIVFSDGEQRFEVFKNGSKIIDKRGEPISSVISYYNFLMTTGFATELS